MNHIAAGPVAGDEAALPSLGARRIPLTPDAPQNLTGEEVHALLLAAVGKGHGAMKRWAYANNIPHQSVRAACCGHQKPSQAMATALGVRMKRGRN